MRLWPASACLVCVVLWAGCSRTDHTASAERSRTTMLDGETVEVRQLADTVDGLCLARRQAPTDPRAARATYQRRSRDGVEITARALQRSNSILASEVAQAKIGVEADLSSDPPGPTLDLRLGSLLETVREGLARFGIPTDACKT